MKLGKVFHVFTTVGIIFCSISGIEGQLDLTRGRQRNRFVLRPSSRPTRPTARIDSTMASLLRQRQRLSLQGTNNMSDLRRQLLQMIAARRSGSTSSAAMTGTRNRSRPVPQCPSISCIPVPVRCRRPTFYMTERGRRCRGCDFNRCEDFESRWEKGFSRIE